MFSDKHEHLHFKSEAQRNSYWNGRLVKSKKLIRRDLFNTIPIGTLGLVLYADNMTPLLVVRWATGMLCPCYATSIFTYNKGDTNG